MRFLAKTMAGTIVVLSGLPAWAQSVAASVAASAPEGPNTVTIPDPGWFIAGFAAGLIVGVIGAKVFGGSSSNR